MTKAIKIGLGIFILAVLIVLLYTAARHWNLFSTKPLTTVSDKFRSPIPPPEKIKLPGSAAIADTTKKPCPCDTVAIRKGWAQVTPRKERKRLAPKREEKVAPPPSQQKVTIDLKVSGQVDVNVHGKVDVEGKNDKTPSPPPEQKPPDIKKGAPCDSCQKVKPWHSHFWGKTFDEKNNK